MMSKLNPSNGRHLGAFFLLKNLQLAVDEALENVHLRSSCVHRPLDWGKLLKVNMQQLAMLQIQQVDSTRACNVVKQMKQQ